jgi:hypothetical protein
MLKYKELLVNPNDDIFRNRARPIKQQVACLCVCPTCHRRYVVKSNSLYTDRINWIYCKRDENNRFRNPEGYDHGLDDNTNKAGLSLKYFTNIYDVRDWQKSKKRLGV